ncbi:6-phosphogluconolactonase [Ilumatobacter sp.]|uniref:6-phosphogluconolactonase n=1 Tax=Ilumatobacter sp. TaxID=1967498 RepID=UPI0037534824
MAKRVNVVKFGSVSVRVSDDPAGDVARSLAVRLRGAIRRRGSASLAVSGGSTAPSMLAALVHEDLDWDRLTVWQVDERVAPDGHEDRNAIQLWFMPTEMKLMPVAGDDLGIAAMRYAETLPDRFDAVHLGLGDDGHTASWPPVPHPDATVVSSPNDVAMVGDFHGRGRMTLTPGPVNQARGRLILTTGKSKADMVRRWLERDRSIPVSHVCRSSTTLFIDPAAAAKLPG